MDQQRHTAEPSHLAQLRKFLQRAKIKDHPDRRPGVEMVDALAVLAETEHFVFTAVPDVDEEILASAEAMHQAGVWRLPYPICTFEFTVRLTLNKVPAFNNEPFRLICALENHAKDGEPSILATWIRGKDGFWIRLTWQHRDANTGETHGSEHYNIRPRPFPTGPAGLYSEGAVKGEEPTVTVDFNTGGEQTDIINAVASCLIMLKTRGIRREKWCGNKPILLNRPEPANAYTRVMVAEAAEAGHGHTVGGVRYRVRLHLRRGHTRNQPHGPGRRYTRQIWIEPCLVGYEDEGRITHEHYEAYPQEHA
jgi:hypothetical protein